MGKRSSRAWWRAAGWLHVVSLVLPALSIWQQPILWGRPHEELWIGAQCLAFGWIVWPGWLANPLVFAAWIAASLPERPRYAIAIPLACLAVPSALAGPLLLADRHGFVSIDYLGPGYYAWVASIVALVIALVSDHVRATRDRSLAAGLQQIGTTEARTEAGDADDHARS